MSEHKESIVALSPSGRRAYEVDLQSVKQALAIIGLHIVTAKDKAVLDAMGAVPLETLERSIANTLHSDEHSRAPARAELARREAP